MYNAQPLRVSEISTPPLPLLSTSPLQHLSSRDLLAELLNDTDVAPGVLASQWPDCLMALAHMDQHALSTALGLSLDAARRLAAALELHHRLVQWQVPKRIKITQPEDALPVLTPFTTLPVEQLLCIPLDAGCRLICSPRVVTVGDVDGTDAGPRAFYRAAIQCGAVQAIAVHNHPSGEASPSAADMAVTRRLAAAGRAVDVTLVDHVIVTPDRSRWTSLRRDHPSAFAV